MEIEPFAERYERALDDEQLHRNLLAFQRKWTVDRVAGLEAAGTDFEEDRARLKAIKNDVIERLPEYLDQFERSARDAGATVVRARGAEDAVAYVLDLVKARGLRRVIKSKSMVTEEIGLNHALEGAGVRVVETDLGEWIVQLAGERPSHIIGPALHKNRLQVADLFSRVTGREIDPEDIAAQVAVAQGALRDEFLGGDLGISGANALVAETGTVMLVTNEGNAELVTSLPRIHVVLVGMEKLIPTLDDAMLQLRLLIPSATAQPMTAYVTWITGASAADTEVHIVVLDNGRLAMRESPLFADALRCVRCGACSNICPSYGVVGGHVFGYVYSGAIGLVNTPFHNGLEHDVGPQSLCVSCNACQTVCPVDIPLPRQILDVRAWAVREAGSPVAEDVGLAVWSQPAAARMALRAASYAQAPMQHGAFVHPPFMGRQTNWRTLPAVARRPFRDRWETTGALPLAGELGRTLGGMTVGFFVQCLTDWLYPEMGEAVVTVLRSLGARVVFPGAQHCCGLPALDTGHLEEARAMARQTISVLEGVPCDYIVTGGTSCAIAVLHEYAHLFSGEPEWQVRAARVADRMLDFTSFLSRVARLPAGSLDGERLSGTYHYFCQSYNVLGFRSEPTSLLGEVCGLALSPLPEANVCCGFGGSVSLQRPDLSRQILDRKLGNVLSTGSQLLVTDNPGCIMQLRGGLAARGEAVRVMHTAEVVAERMRGLRRVQGGE